MTMRATLHRWWVVAVVTFSMSMAALRFFRRSRNRRRLLRRIDVWPW